MIPPRFVPPGILQLYEIDGNDKTLLQEFPTSSRNRDRINRMRLDLLMIYPTKTFTIAENNSLL
jgi:hypothetical protein